MTPPTVISNHAIGRFRERYVPGEPWVRAAARLTAICRRAEHVESISDEGQEIWRGREIDSIVDVLLVVRGGIVRTVLPPGAQRPAGRRRT